MGAQGREILFLFTDEEQDQAFYQQLKTHLQPLLEKEQYTCWSHLDVSPGRATAEQLHQHLISAPIIVVLLSPHYLASEQSDIVDIAIHRHQTDEARVIPILVRLCDYKNSPFGAMKVLPANEQPVSTWTDRDAACADIVTGIAKIIQSLNPSTSVSERNQFWTVPYPRNLLFTGRDEELQAIENALRSGQDAAIVQAISGLGGLGKTQLALEYAFRHRQDYRYVFWALADTRDTLNTEYSKIAELLNLPERNLSELPFIIIAVKSWLEKHPDWLLVLDNADDLELLKAFLPTTYSGHILLTTRASAMGRLAERIELKELSDSKGVEFLLQRSGTLKKGRTLEMIDPKEREAASSIVRELGGLPLALDQAGAYIEETTCGLQGYLTLYRKERKLLLKERGGKVDDHPESVATTWQLAFQRIAKADPAATDLLRLCAFLAPDDIPEMIIVDGESELTGPLKKLARNPLKLNAAIATLQNYSLVSRNPVTRTLDIHRLVQVVLRDAMMKNVAQAWAVRTVRAINKVFPWPEEIENWAICQQLLPHARVGVELIDDWQIETEESAVLLNCAGAYLQNRAEYREAQQYFAKALVISRKIFGEKALFTATCISNLATIYDVQGKYASAALLYQETLVIEHAALGKKHPETAISLSNLANVYQSQGKYAEAELLYQEALTIQRAVLSKEHLDTARSLNNLASMYQSQGKYVEAELLYQEALSIRRVVLGKEHPDTADSLNGLALVYEKQGKHQLAEPLYEQSLAIQRKVLGEVHPDTAIGLYNLAHVYKGQGKYGEAENFYKQALTIQQKTFGNEHPDPAYSLNGLGELYLAQERYSEAETLVQQALTIRQKMLGKAHPETATSLHSLAVIYKSQEKYEEALPLFEKALKIRQEKLVPEHAEIKETRERYEETLSMLEKKVQAD